MFIHNSKQQYDLILLDAYTAGGRIPFHLTTREFLTDVREHLRPRGVALMNVISSVKGAKSKLYRAELKTFGAVFGAEHVYVFPKILHDTWDPEESTNVMLIATGPGHARRLGDKQAAEEVAQQLVNVGKIRIMTIPRHAANKLTDGEQATVPQDDVPVLTDDYAPVDMMTVNLH